MALNSLHCAEVPLTKLLTHSLNFSCRLAARVSEFRLSQQWRQKTATNQPTQRATATLYANVEE